jgi:hypothetical protein
VPTSSSYTVLCTSKPAAWILLQPAPPYFALTQWFFILVLRSPMQPPPYQAAIAMSRRRAARRNTRTPTASQNHTGTSLSLLSEMLAGRSIFSFVMLSLTSHRCAWYSSDPKTSSGFQWSPVFATTTSGGACKRYVLCVSECLSPKLFQL